MSHSTVIPPGLDKYVLYEAAVQNPRESVRTIQRLYRRSRGALPTRLREDFCGTAAISCEWVRRRPANRAWGLDLDPNVLDWARKHNRPHLGRAKNRVTLIEGDVMHHSTPPVDVVAAFNFSYCIFKQREALRNYFRAARVSLRPGGMFICDLFGGTGAMTTNREKRRVKAFIRPDGIRVPNFRYIWEHEHFNVINHHILCHIHFKLKHGPRLTKAFTYDWRLWTLPEMTEILEEAGFIKPSVFIHGWTPDGDSDDIYRLRTSYENEEGWLAYITAWNPNESIKGEHDE